MYKKDFRKIDTTWNLFIVRKNWNTGWANSGRKRNEKDERPPRGRRQKRKRKRKEQKSNERHLLPIPLKSFAKSSYPSLLG